jgi:hypothetical protein
MLNGINCIGIDRVFNINRFCSYIISNVLIIKEPQLLVKLATATNVPDSASFLGFLSSLVKVTFLLRHAVASLVTCP